MIGKKTISRLSVSVFATLNTIAPMLSNFVLAYLVIQNKGPEQWGTLVEDIIVVALAAHVLSWGNRDFLIVRYAQDSGQISQHWLSSLSTRAILLIPIAIIFLVLFNPEKSLWLMIWLAGVFLTQSLDSVITFSKNFKPSMVVELFILFSTTVIVALYGSNLNHKILVMVFSVAAISRGFLLTILYIKGGIPRPVISRDHFLLAAPFFLIGFSGFLQSRADIYIVGSILPAAEVAMYQVAINTLLLCHMLFAIGLSPYLGSIYRLSDSALKRFVARYYQMGFSLFLAVIPMLFVLWELIYKFELSLQFYIISILYLFPIVIYIPMIYNLYRKGMQKKVMYAGFAAAFLNITSTFLIVRFVGFEYALAGPAFTNWILMFSYTKINRNGI